MTKPNILLTQSLFFLIQNTWLISECPRGYIFTEGDIKGWGQLEGRIKLPVIDDCAKLCNEESRCCSFEYSKRSKKCNLNSDCQPTRDKYKDYAFCIKTENAAKGEPQQTLSRLSANSKQIRNILGASMWKNRSKKPTV